MFRIRQLRYGSGVRNVVAGGTVALAILVALPGTATARAASAGPITATYQGTAIQGKVLGTAASWGQSATSAPVVAGTDRVLPFRSPSNQSHAPATSAGAPLVSPSTLGPEGTLASNFDGLTDTQNKAIVGFHDTPPDQGLCVGTLTGFGGTVVIEAVNSIFGIYTTGGTLLSSFPITVGFFDPNAFSDPRCFWDPATKTFYMTVISCFFCGPPGTADTVDDVLVVASSGAATTYQFSTNVGGTCFGDQPHTGYDSDAVWVATDEFCGTSGNTFSGTLLIGISKSQLVAQGATPNALSFGPLSLGSVPILTLQPAFGNESGKEFLLNSFPYDQFGNNNSISKLLGFWVVTGDAAITTGSGIVTLSGKIINSETYAFPMPAASTGDGSVNGSGITSEAFLNPDDSRMQQVQLVKDELHGLQLYASLSTAVNISGDPSARDGAAWFVINPAKGNITSQGYVAVAGAYLLYPAILHTSEGTTTMAFTITSPTINPSAAFVVRKSTSPGFGSVQTAAAGTGPHVSFSDFFFGRARWGDYSAVTLDPSGRDVWSATEYIGPPPGGTDLVDNWGTRIWDVTGDH